MAQYQYGQFVEKATEEQYDPKQAEKSVRNSILKSFVWMGLGLLFSGLASAVVCLTDLKFLFWRTSIYLVMMLVQFGLTIAFSSSMNKASIAALRGMFLAFCLTMGLTLSSIGLAYDFTTITAALLLSAVYFGCLVSIGLTTKKDLSRFGTFLMAGLIALIIGGVFCLIFRMTEALPFMVLGLLLFTGLSAYDVQRLKVSLQASQGMPVQQEKLALYFALEMYLDFVNIFLYILRFLGKAKDN